MLRQSDIPRSSKGLAVSYIGTAPTVSSKSAEIVENRVFVVENTGKGMTVVYIDGSRQHGDRPDWDFSLKIREISLLSRVVP